MCEHCLTSPFFHFIRELALLTGIFHFPSSRLVLTLFFCKQAVSFLDKGFPLGKALFYLRRSRQIRERKVLFFLLLLGDLGGLFSNLSPMYTQNGCIQRKLFFKKDPFLVSLGL